MDKKQLFSDLGFIIESEEETPILDKSEQRKEQYREQIARQEKELSDLQILLDENDKKIKDEIELKVEEYRQQLQNIINEKKSLIIDKIRIPLESAKAELAKLEEKE